MTSYFRRVRSASIVYALTVKIVCKMEKPKPYKEAPAKYTSKVWKYFGFSKSDESN